MAVANKPRILVVDDDRAAVRQLTQLLGDEDYDVRVARDGVEALERVRAEPPDLMLLDVMMPKMNGLEVCRMVKSMSADTFIPIILVTVKGDVDSKVTGLKLGADDYLAKPYNPLELRARVESMLRIKALQDKVNARRRELEALSVTDQLTRLLNRRAMQARLRDEYRRAQRYNEPLSILLVDIDRFHGINDEHGHDAGDQLLHDFARLLERSIRDIDIVARFGGEEFLIILPQTHFTGSLSVADRVWRAVRKYPFSTGGQTVNVTASIGIAFYPTRDVNSVEELLQCANEALEQAKADGRDRICLHQHLKYMYRPDGTTP